MKAWNELCSDEVLEAANIRGKAQLSDFQRVLTLTYQRQSVSAIASALGCSRRAVIEMQHQLKMRQTNWTGRQKLSEVRT